MSCVLSGNVTMDFSTDLLFAYTRGLSGARRGRNHWNIAALAYPAKGHCPDEPTWLGVAYRSPVALEGFVRNKRRQPLELTAHNLQPTWDFLEVDRYAQRPPPARYASSRSSPAGAARDGVLFVRRRTGSTETSHRIMYSRK
jgi:hypothetical protein